MDGNQIVEPEQRIWTGYKMETQKAFASFCHLCGTKHQYYAYPSGEYDQNTGEKIYRVCAVCENHPDCIRDVIDHYVDTWDDTWGIYLEVSETEATSRGAKIVGEKPRSTWRWWEFWKSIKPHRKEGRDG